MVSPQWPDKRSLDEVDQLMLNAQLRDQLEPFLDESVDLVNVKKLPTSMENEYLASMLACCLLYTSPSPRDATLSRMPSSA